MTGEVQGTLGCGGTFPRSDLSSLAAPSLSRPLDGLQCVGFTAVVATVVGSTGWAKGPRTYLDGREVDPIPETSRV